MDRLLDLQLRERRLMEQIIARLTQAADSVSSATLLAAKDQVLE